MSGRDPSVTPANGGGSSGGAAVDRSPQLRLARMHLRTGSLALARAELEALAGRGDLDRGATLDLAEVRWRSGDLTGAGDAVTSYLSAGGDETLGFVIAAEAAAAGGRPAEARRFAGRALERSEASLDALFAGMPRSMIWPHDTWAEASPGAVSDRLDAAIAGGTDRGRDLNADLNVDVNARAPSRAVPPSTVRSDQLSQSAPQPGLWDLAAPTGARSRREAEAELEAGARELRAGDSTIAAVHFGVALRLASGLAGAVLAAVGGSEDPSLQLVRGDCQRLLGHEREARRAYLAAAAARRAASPTDHRESGNGPEVGAERTERQASPTGEPPGATPDEPRAARTDESPKDGANEPSNDEAS